MTTTMLSSPLGPSHTSSRYDIFEQPSSPTFKHDDLPDEFGDQSFGSSMSLGSSFELNRMVASSSSSSQLSALSSYSYRTRVVDDQATIRLSRRTPPRLGQESLGAAMGTVLDSRSPSLAKKMSSVDYMDISSPPSQHNNTTPSRVSRGLAQVDHNLPPGSAMKEDTPVRMNTSSISRRCASERSDVANGSLGRLFGTELSQNSRRMSYQTSSGMGEDSFDSQASPDKEPPLKRRPSSLPLTSANNPGRPSVRSAGMAPPSAPLPTASRRPNLLKSMTTGQTIELGSRRDSLEALRKLNRGSEPALSTTKTFGANRSGRSRSDSSTDRADNRELFQPQRSSLPPLHPTIVESPSPSTLRNEEFGSYFFNPQSPELGRTCPPQSSIESNLSSQPSASTRPRTFAKSATLAIVPSIVCVAGSSTSTLGKRLNPYGRRPTFNTLHTTAFSQLAVSSSAAPTASTVARMKAPAPRRCQSAIDNSAAFAQAAEDMSMCSVDGGDQSFIVSPSDRTNQSSLLGREFPSDFDATGSPIAPSARPKAVRPTMIRKTSKDDSFTVGYGTEKHFLNRMKDKDGNSNKTVAFCISPPQMGDDDAAASTSSPFRSAEGLPGFGASEREGKILPCFSVKDDGLMRITPTTLVEVLQGQYDQKMTTYQIIDCRFGYEFEGGHISGAINLSTMERVKKHFLLPQDKNDLPIRSQSGKVDAAGHSTKKVLIFHCEFSCKRAPSMALALRQADRSLAHDYPNCHFPEIYILQGGYCGFFKEYANVCEPRSYVEMDDPKFQEKRSVELNGFRKQFSRHRSFAYGDSFNSSKARLPHSDGTLSLNNPSFLARATLIREEVDSSFEKSASPSAVQADSALARRNFVKATTISAVTTSSSTTRTEAFSSFLGSGRSVLGSLPNSTAAAGDISFGSSVGDESSFDAGPSDSPCAAAANQRRPATYGKLQTYSGGSASGIVQQMRANGSNGGSLGRQSIHRAATASHINLR
ncbi:hypothetical protein CBS101457_006006 [Exobasidium rhododendri]|nr:hypothetical protein CBS101457_006006 [Exobasidium rhododendri]